MDLYIYWVYFCLIGVATSFVWVVILGVTSEIFKFKMEDMAIALYLFTCVASIGPISFYTLKYFEITPKETELSIIQISDAAKKLNEKLISLKKLVESPEDIKLSELPEITNKVISITGELQSQSNEQSKTISTLVSEVEQERKKANEAKLLVNTLQSLTKEQLNAVKWLITEDAKEAAEISFYKNILVSFIFGILASLVATMIYRKFGSKVNKKTGELIKHESPAT
jgi:hypothetical protein